MTETLPKLHTIEEAAKILRITPGTLRQWTHEKKIGYFKVGSKVCISERQIMNFLRNREVKIEIL